jgi:hypothetical protein
MTFPHSGFGRLPRLPLGGGPSARARHVRSRMLPVRCLQPAARRASETRHGRLLSVVAAPPTGPSCLVWGANRRIQLSVARPSPVPEPANRVHPAHVSRERRRPGRSAAAGTPSEWMGTKPGHVAKAVSAAVRSTSRDIHLSGSRRRAWGKSLGTGCRDKARQHIPASSQHRHRDLHRDTGSWLAGFVSQR